MRVSGPELFRCTGTFAGSSTVVATPTPEAATWALLGSAILGMVGLAVRPKRTTSSADF
jgi:hypothetical protein